MLHPFEKHAPAAASHTFAPIPTAPPLAEEESCCACGSPRRAPPQHEHNGQHHDQHHHSASLAARAAASIRVQTIECVTATVVIALLVLACVWSYFHCFWCLVGIAVFCLCLCPFVHFYNFPLWLAIVLLVLSLWAYLTAGEMRVGPFLLHWSRVETQ